MEAGGGERQRAPTPRLTPRRSINSGNAEKAHLQFYRNSGKSSEFQRPNCTRARRRKRSAHCHWRGLESSWYNSSEEDRLWCYEDEERRQFVWSYLRRKQATRVVPALLEPYGAKWEGSNKLDSI